MMNEKRVFTWEEFKGTVEEIKNDYGIIDRGPASKISNDILFRGHADSSWKLETTLERRSKAGFRLTQYLKMAAKHVEEIEAFSGKDWDLPSFDVMRERIKENGHSLCPIPCYGYLVYLRHFGFPSPLLDWSKSPFIAAFFAFAKPGNSERAIYVSVPDAKGDRVVEASDPVINVHGPYVKAGRRHFSQRAWYTTSTKYSCELNDEGFNGHEFIGHERVFSEDKKGQDILYKITLPGSLRRKVLGELADYNVSDFAIFHSEDALIDTIAMRVFDLE